MRTTSAAAAAPNSRIIGGAGTGVGPPPDEPPLLDEPPWLEDPPLELQPPFELQPLEPWPDEPLLEEP